MKKILVGILAALMAVSFVAGCKITPEQGKVIAQNAGLYSAVIWISTDNPTTEQKTIVSGILDVIKTNAISVKQGQTYTEVLYPEVEKVIDATVQEQDRPLAKAAAITLLNGIDTLFAMHPDWKTQQDLAVDIVSSFVDGAKAGLIMTDKDPIIIQAKKAAQARAKVFADEKNIPVSVKDVKDPVAKKKGWFGCNSSK
jgi:hypothetical protein